MLGWPMLGEQIGEDVDDVVRPEPPQRHHRQAFPAVLVDDVEHPELPAVVRLILDKVVGPHMPAVQRAQPDARPVAKPEPAALRLSLRHLYTLPPPDALDHRQADLPAGLPEQRMGTALDVKAIIPHQPDNCGRQTPLIPLTYPRTPQSRRVTSEA